MDLIHKNKTLLSKQLLSFAKMTNHVFLNSPLNEISVEIFFLLIKSNFVVFFDTVLDSLVVLGLPGPLRQPNMHVAPVLS